MEHETRILSTVKYICGSILAIGIIIFSIGYFDSGYNILTPVGIGTIMAAVFIFLLGTFFIASEEMVEKIASEEKVAHIAKDERHERRSFD